MTEVAASSYDEVPYASNPFHYSHPDTLATAAILRGLAAAPLVHCRVLELGCAGGGNLLPMAQALPESRFVGIDLSPRQIAEGQALQSAAGIKNAELKTMSILDVGEDFGQFDYIICHGVYSWVPTDVQDKILDICKKNLAPSGVAYVSYNTFPGWHMRSMVREMMLYHVRGFPGPRQRVQQARALLEMLVSSCGQSDSAYTHALKEELQALGTAEDHYIFHEHLETVNEPIYFHQFIERAAAKGLQYLGEARPDFRAARLPPDVKQKLSPLAHDVIRREQYTDFLVSRRFRWTLLSHVGLPVRHALYPDVLPNLRVGGFLVPKSPGGNLKSDERITFIAPSKVEVSSSEPGIKAAFVILAQLAPLDLDFETICQKAQALTGAPEPMTWEQRQRLASTVLQCYEADLMELHAYPPAFVRDISERPRTTSLLRCQAAAGPRVTNLRHRLVDLPPFDRAVLLHLDGSHSRQDLVALLVDDVRTSKLQANTKDGSRPTPDAIPGILEKSLEPALTRLALNALLIG